ncbi:MAG TPA: APC family permease [Candidatus Hypogeohydataceae bacterium YC41]
MKTLFTGRPRSLYDPRLFQKLSLGAFFAWVGLGSDAISSCCYGPPEAFLALQGHAYLSIFVALGTVLTIFVISAGYSQIVELFPTGGGGYLVASKLLSPTVGMLSGCALLLDYVLVITISFASGVDAILSFLPAEWHSFQLEIKIAGIAILTLLNLRGIKEPTILLVPLFLTFLTTHTFAILYALVVHLMKFPELVQTTMGDIHKAHSEIGLAGMIFLVVRAYSLGAGTYTGIEAVSNGLPMLREPKVKTAKRTMLYMAISLAFLVMGLMLSYLFYRVEPQFGKTLNAVLFNSLTSDWGRPGYVFVIVTLVSEATILFVAAQTGFFGGPWVLANMALDSWFPTRFAILSDRLVTQNGVLLMGSVASGMMLLTDGSVRLLVVLYSINVFITFVLSQLGMVRYWWRARSRVRHWLTKLLVNGMGLGLTAFILVSMVVFKFLEGGWITLLITGTLIGIAILIKRHYNRTARLLRRLDELVLAAASPGFEFIPGITSLKPNPEFDPKSKTAVLLVNGFNGMGLHTLFNVIRLFEGVCKNFVFVQVGIIDAGNFKGAAEVERLKTHVKSEVDRYVDFMRRHGYYAEGFTSIGTDVVDEVVQITPRILERFPQAIFFGGRLAFPKDSFFTRLLHNYTLFVVQRGLYEQGIPLVILPIRI